MKSETTTLKAAYKRCHIDFTQSGWQQFKKINSNLGSRFIRAFILCHEVKQYILAHESQGIILDTECQELRYEDGLYLILKKMAGVWYITDVVMTAAPASFEPIFTWARIKLGWKEFAMRSFACWRSIFHKAAQASRCDA